MNKEELDILLNPYSDYIFEEDLNDNNFSYISLVILMKEKKSIPIFIKFYRDIIPHIHKFDYFEISTRMEGLFLDVTFIRKNKDKLLIDYNKNFRIKDKNEYYFQFYPKEFDIFIEFLKDVLTNRRGGVKVISIKNVISYKKKTDTYTTVVVLNIKDTGYE